MTKRLSKHKNNCRCLKLNKAFICVFSCIKIILKLSCPNIHSCLFMLLKFQALIKCGRIGSHTQYKVSYDKSALVFNLSYVNPYCFHDNFYPPQLCQLYSVFFRNKKLQWQNMLNLVETCIPFYQRPHFFFKNPFSSHQSYSMEYSSILYWSTSLQCMNKMKFLVLWIFVRATENKPKMWEFHIHIGHKQNTIIW